MIDSNNGTTTKLRKKLVKHLILDTGGVIANINLHEIAENYYAPHEVVDELRSLRAKVTFDTLPFEVILREPSSDAIRRVVEKSKATGDYTSLSVTDIKVIALTYDIHDEFCRNPDDIIESFEAKASLQSDVGVPEPISDSRSVEKCTRADSDDADGHADSVDIRLEKVIPEGFCEDGNSDDEDGWITEDNLSQALKKIGALEVDEGVVVGCLTTDFAVQNVLLKMHLGLVSLNGYRIKQLRSFVLRCRACFNITPIITKEFCPACGHKMLHKCAVSVDENGEQVLHINWQRLAVKRGLKHSLAAPKGGKHAVNEKLFQDQPMPQNRMATIRSDPFAESPFPMHDVTSRSAMLGIRSLNSRQKRRRNPNEPVSRRRKFAMSTVYYCHQCRNNVPLRNTDMICGVCGGEFLEQITVPPPSRMAPPPHHLQHQHAPPNRNVLASIMGVFNAFSQPNQQQPMSPQNEINGGDVPLNIGRPQGPQSMTFSLEQAMQVHPILSQVLATLGNPNMQVRIHIGDDADGVMHGAFGDYVWGENGMDRIVTQLFNQMDGNLRPIGLTEQQINRLPIIKVSEQHVEKATQCTTCFEDFKKGELVVELLCRHIFHPQCVVPWLQQRPSCPICRQEVVALQFPEPAPGAPTVSSLGAKHDLIEPELD
ncbi:hypothetical protein KIN20_005467 [Parelaphostrongylus tenuis]|uniref:RING-type domain-containing protein n=1 Tax=Parelaphostrongylus tenuis TaxID=148309 RepID=A0AAD5MST5_PARTN|nr:hypothetical protein KIN20_005467 [Parelaphostrongylus tenuis]